MAIIRMVTNYAELVSLIAEAKIPHVTDAEAQTIDLAPASAALPETLRIRWQKQNPFVDFVQHILRDVPKERVADLETAILRLNHTAPIAGLGIDHGVRLVYQRATAVVLADGLRIDLVHVFLQGVQLNARRLRPALQRVVDGLSGDAILTVA
jgi:hypothetical protein